MKPTVGQIVHYRTRGSADGVYPPEDRAAIITATPETCPDLRELSKSVSLMVVFQTAIRFELSVPYDPMGLVGHSWHWPEREG